MTEQEIKQRAKQHADYFYQDRNSLFWSERYNSYIAGAHSRDEEIAELKETIRQFKNNKIA